MMYTVLMYIVFVVYESSQNKSSFGVSEIFVTYESPQK